MVRTAQRYRPRPRRWLHSVTFGAAETPTASDEAARVGMHHASQRLVGAAAGPSEEGCMAAASEVAAAGAAALARARTGAPIGDEGARLFCAVVACDETRSRALVLTWFVLFGTRVALRDLSVPLSCNMMCGRA